MASSLSQNIGPSYIKVDCYKKETFDKEFKNYYRINEKINLIETNKKLETALLDWFGNEKKIIESITYWFELKISKDNKVYLSEKKLRDELDNKRKDFYTLDDLMFIEIDKYIIVLLLGNNE